MTASARIPKGEVVPKIVPNFLFEYQSQEAVEFYVSVFPNSKITNISYFNEAGPLPAGTVLTVEFLLDGQEFLAINSGAAFEFNESISFSVSCASQEEVDHYWDLLCTGGEESQCGWLKDRFGVSWQVVPAELGKYLGDPDPVRAQKAMKAMLGMHKLDLALFQAAVDAT
jgi:predicted 3-demethylubiquinone-9 3-methyltransferase (glyoxalase superfamily)